MDHRKNSSGLSRLHPRSIMRRFRQRLSKLRAPSYLVATSPSSPTTSPSSPATSGSSLAADRNTLQANDTIIIGHYLDFNTDSDSEYTISTLFHNEPTFVIFDIPPELFDRILFFVGLSQPDIRQHIFWLSSSVTRTKLLQNCALVCRHWANQCRRYLFHGATLRIYSYKALESLFYYALHGSPSLVPIHTLIFRINVVQTYNEPSSFLHRVFSFKHIADTQAQLFHLEITGPIPFNSPTCKFDTPHWSLPASISTPPSLTPYEHISLTVIHLPSFGHVAKYISHFKLATQIYFRDLTWDDDGPQELPTSIIRGPTQPRIPDEDFTLNISRCTNNGRIALQVMSTYKHFPLYILSDDLSRERHAVIMWINGLFGNESNDIQSLRVKTTWIRSTIDVRIALVANELSLCLTLHNYEPDESQDTRTSNFHVSSFYARMSPSAKAKMLRFEQSDSPTSVSWNHASDELTNSPLYETRWPELHGLQTYLDQFSMLEAIAITFDNYNELLFNMAAHRPIPFNPLIAHNKYVLVCERTDDELFPEVARRPSDLLQWPYSDWVEINPITLAPTGQVWSKEDDIIPSLLSLP